MHIGIYMTHCNYFVSFVCIHGTAMVLFESQVVIQSWHFANMFPIYISVCIEIRRLLRVASKSSRSPLIWLFILVWGRTIWSISKYDDLPSELVLKLVKRQDRGSTPDYRVQSIVTPPWHSSVNFAQGWTRKVRMTPEMNSVLVKRKLLCRLETDWRQFRWTYSDVKFWK